MRIYEKIRKIFCLSIIILFTFCLFSCGDSKYPVKEEQITVNSRFDNTKSFFLTLNIGSQKMSNDGACFFTATESLDGLHNFLKTNNSFYDYDSTDIRFLKDGYFYGIELVAKEKNYNEYKLFSDCSALILDDMYYQIPFPRSFGVAVNKEYTGSSQNISYLDSYFFKCANITKDGEDKYIVKNTKCVNDQSLVDIVITKMDGKFVFSLKGDSNDNSK